MTLYRHALTDSQWTRIEPHLPAPKGRHGRNDRLFLDAVLWAAKTGAPWRDLPARLGAWEQVYQRFARWCDRGHFDALFQALQAPDLEQVMVDSTSCKAHQASSGAKKKGVLKRLESLVADSTPRSTRCATHLAIRCDSN